MACLLEARHPDYSDFPGPTDDPVLPKFSRASVLYYYYYTERPNQMNGNWNTGLSGGHRIPDTVKQSEPKAVSGIGN
jgi:hypothetical protein